ncbi:hypothetical protein ACWEO2_16830 [Nocardia sp. NPDC004278]
MLTPSGPFIQISDRKNTPPPDRGGLVDPAPSLTRYAIWSANTLGRSAVLAAASCLTEPRR